MIKYAASYYPYYVCEFRILNSNFFKTLTQGKKSPDSKISNWNQGFNQIGNKNPGQTSIFKDKKEVDQCIMIVHKILWKQSDHQKVFSRQKIVLMKKGKKCLSLSVQCSFLGNVWMAFKHRNRRRPCYNSYTKVTLIFHAILVVSVKFLLQFLIKVWHLIW